VTLLGSLQNFAGWDGVSNITNEGTLRAGCYVYINVFTVYNSEYGGNTNGLLQTK